MKSHFSRDGRYARKYLRLTTFAWTAVKIACSPYRHASLCRYYLLLGDADFEENLNPQTLRGLSHQNEDGYSFRFSFNDDDSCVSYTGGFVLSLLVSGFKTVCQDVVESSSSYAQHAPYEGCVNVIIITCSLNDVFSRYIWASLGISFAATIALNVFYVWPRYRRYEEYYK